MATGGAYRKPPTIRGAGTVRAHHGGTRPDQGGGGRAPRRRPPHAGAPLRHVLGVGRLRRVPEVREPAEDRRVQDPRRVHQDPVAVRRRARGGRDRPLGGQPRAGRRLGGPLGGRSRRCLHAALGVAGQDRRDRGLRRPGRADRRQRRRRGRGGPRRGRPQRQDARPSVRRRGGDRRAGHGRPGDPRGRAGRGRRGRPAGRGRAAVRHRLGGQGPAAGDPRDRRRGSRLRAVRRVARAWRDPPGATDGDDRRRHRGQAPGGDHVPDHPRPGRRRDHGDRRRDRPDDRPPAGADEVGRRGRRRRRPGGPVVGQDHGAPGRSPSSPEATSTRRC